MNEDGKNLKDRAEELMSKKELQSKISRKKAELQPIIKEPKQLREDIDNMSGEHEASKSKYHQINHQLLQHAKAHLAVAAEARL